MARPILASGKPYPRKRPINWTFVKQVLASRRFHDNMMKQGYTEVGHHGPWAHTSQGAKMTDAVVSPDGRRLYIKLAQPH